MIVSYPEFLPLNFTLVISSSSLDIFVTNSMMSNIEYLVDTLVFMMVETDSLIQLYESNTNVDSGISTVWISLIIALIAVFFGPIIQFYVSRQRTEAQLVTSKEQIRSQLTISEQQIKAQLAISEQQSKAQLATSKEQIRSQLAISDKQIKTNVLSMNRQQWINSIRDQISEFVSVLLTIVLAKDTITFGTENLISKLERLFFLTTKIKLLTNPNESDHSKLIELMDNIMKNINKTEDKEVFQKIENAIDEITSLSQKILKREWQRVKNLE